MRRGWFVLLFTLLLGHPVFAAVVYVMEVKDHTASPPQAETIQMHVEGRQLKIELAPGERHGMPGGMIYRGDRREMVVLDDAHKSYIVIDRQTVQSMAEQYKQAMNQVQETLKNVPENQRAVVEKMMQERMAQMSAQPPKRPQSEVRKTGERSVQVGYPCEKYEIWQDGKKGLDLWVTNWEKVEGGREVKPVFKDLATFVKEIQESFASASGASGGFGGQFDGSFFAYLDQIDGFPVLAREFAEGSLARESTLRSAKRQSPNPAAFELPAGYTQRKLIRDQ